MNSIVKIPKTKNKRSKLAKRKEEKVYAVETTDENLDEMVQEVQDELKQEVEQYNKTKTDIKKSYSRIQQLRGGLDVLLSLAENYKLVPKE